MSFQVKVSVPGPLPDITDTYRGPQEIVDHELALARKKGKARPVIVTSSQANNEAGKMKRRALTPGTSPAGS